MAQARIVLPEKARLLCACEHISISSRALFLSAYMAPCLNLDRSNLLRAQRPQVLDELAQTPVPVLNPHVPAVVAFLLEMVKADALEATTRDQAGMCLNTLAEHKPKLLGKKGLVPPILEAMLHLMASSNESAAGSLNLALADNEHDPADGITA